jgi:hypothetical protein
LLRGCPLGVEFLLLTTQIGLLPLAPVGEFAERRLGGVELGAIGGGPSDGFGFRLRL